MLLIIIRKFLLPEIFEIMFINENVKAQWLKNW
jgi:hypothetical protein